MTMLSIRIDDALDAELARLAEALQRNKSDLVRDMLRRQTAVYALQQAQAALRPYAERTGYLTDEDFFRDFS
ncbi:MAG: ribbon-helix-helix domain-containing protein [Xanthomonadales bacterium]|jgi:predicted transcriptional regulator|nr:ribbon-helix-helix domain-containing protein [Xanthomonadales bacterium]